MLKKHHIKSSLPDNIHDIQITVSQEKGVISSIMALFITLAVVVALSVYWMQAYLYAPATIPTKSPIVCTQDAVQCGDGSYVSRIGPNCEFAKCSDKNTDEAGYRSQEDCEQKTGEKCGYGMCDVVPKGKTSEEVCGNFNQGWIPFNKANEKAVTSTSNWKTYRNEKYGFEVRYPSDLLLIQKENNFFISSQNKDILYFDLFILPIRETLDEYVKDQSQESETNGPKQVSKKNINGIDGFEVDGYGSEGHSYNDNFYFKDNGFIWDISLDPVLEGKITKEDNPDELYKMPNSVLYRDIMSSFKLTHTQ